MKRTIWTLLALVAGGLLALLVVPERLQIVLGKRAEERREAPQPPPPDRTDEVLAAVEDQRQVLKAFAEAMDQEAQDRQAADQAAAQRAEAIEKALAARSGDLAPIERRLEELTVALRQEITGLREVMGPRAGTPAGGGDKPPDAVEVPEGVPAEPAAEPSGAGAPPPPAEPAAESKAPVPPKRRTLAELLKAKQTSSLSDSYVLYKLLKGYCRVGFDGSSTLHNFTAKTEEVEGSFSLRWSAIAERAEGSVAVALAGLDSGEPARDEEIRTHLGAPQFPAVRAEVLGFETGVKREGETLRAVARLRFSIRGRTVEVKAPVVLEMTRQRLLHVTGEAKLRISDFDIHPKAKMGLIKVDDGVTVWWDLHAEPEHGKG